MKKTGVLANHSDTLSAIVSLIGEDPAEYMEFIKFLVKTPSYAPFSPEKSFLLKEQSEVVHLEPDLTDHCQLGCPTCSFKNVRTRASLELELLKEILESLKKENKTISVTFSGGGDPLMAPHLTEALELVNQYTADSMMITCGYTNKEKLPGIVKNNAEALLNNLKMIRFSLDDTLRGDPEKLAETLSHVEYLREKKQALESDCKITLAALIDYRSENFEEDSQQIAEIANKFKLPLLVRPAFDFINRPTIHHLKDVIKKTEWFLSLLDPSVEISMREALERVLLVGLRWNEKTCCPLVDSGRHAKIRADGTIFQCIQLATLEKEFSELEMSQFTRDKTEIGIPVDGHVPTSRCIYCRETSINYRWQLLENNTLHPEYLADLKSLYNNGNNFGYFW